MTLETIAQNGQIERIHANFLLGTIETVFVDVNVDNIFVKFALLWIVCLAIVLIMILFIRILAVSTEKRTTAT